MLVRVSIHMLDLSGIPYMNQAGRTVLGLGREYLARAGRIDVESSPPTAAVSHGRAVLDGRRLPRP